MDTADFFLYLGIQLLCALAIKGTLVLSGRTIPKTIELILIAGAPAIITALIYANGPG
ncbi:hypothetical protein [Pseudomonas fontis]|uniref:Uncharacterized protein n=1 Tax=Pseudomonas fontis TaxID=2942633 RepID=A0ABT5NLQ2_9PSED|nr:hypothetical protein [Pseudomonas fontis]MDD0975995.1 hypothetical protein [Pseudomonas fontis]MDD0989148.1 hypothetical protein [Pseudomonas fontis]